MLMKKHNKELKKIKKIKKINKMKSMYLKKLLVKYKYGNGNQVNIPKNNLINNYKR